MKIKNQIRTGLATIVAATSLALPVKADKKQLFEQGQYRVAENASLDKVLQVSEYSGGGQLYHVCLGKDEDGKLKVMKEVQYDSAKMVGYRQTTVEENGKQMVHAWITVEDENKQRKSFAIKVTKKDYASYLDSLLGDAYNAYSCGDRVRIAGVPSSDEGNGFALTVLKTPYALATNCSKENILLKYILDGATEE